MRLAFLDRSAAPRWVWPVATVLLVWGLWAAMEGRTTPPPPRAGTAQSDLHLFGAVTERVRAGESYYTAMAAELPARNYATQSVFNWRLPTLFHFAAALPPTVLRVVLISFCFAVVVAWLAVTRREAPSVAVGAMPLLFMSVPAAMHPMGPMMHELWAGLAIAGALAVRSLGWPAVAVVLGASALAIRELSLPFVGVMALLAWLEGRRGEAGAWAVIAAAFGALMAWHAGQVASVMPPGGESRNWIALGGWPFVLSTSHANPLLGLSPPWVAALLLPVAVAGLWSWTGTLGRRLAWVVSAYSVLFMIAGRPDNWYWGLMVTPLIPLGFYGWFVRRTSSPGSLP